VWQFSNLIETQIDPSTNFGPYLRIAYEHELIDSQLSIRWAVRWKGSLWYLALIARMR
jgi:hypothetical protein